MEPTGWRDFFVAAAGAAAALAGLVVVAISVNIERILNYPQLPARAAAAVCEFVAALAVSLIYLAPQPTLAIGLEVVIIASIPLALQINAGRVSVRSDRNNGRPTREAVFEIVREQAQALPFVIAGILLIFSVPAAPYFLLAGIVLIFALSMFETWVLLVETLR